MKIKNKVLHLRFGFLYYAMLSPLVGLKINYDYIDM